MKKISLVLLALFLMACGKEQHDLTVKANIEGLKKGTLYLKKVEDTTLVIIDSLVVNGNTNIELHSDLDSPEVFYLYLDKNSAEKDRITFFADKGITEINTTLKNFAFEFEIKGSEQQKTLEEYQTVIDKINNRYYIILKSNLKPEKQEIQLNSIY